jgi:hypothetical protein
LQPDAALAEAVADRLAEELLGLNLSDFAG